MVAPAKCTKFPWATKNYSISNPTERAVVFLFNQKNTYSGGLGDRLAGIISSFAFSIRTNRTFILVINDYDTGLSKAFQSHHKYVLYSNQSIISNDTYDLTFCINPSNSLCSMDFDVPHKTVIVRSNRALLCRWTSYPQVAAYQELLHMGISNTTDLYEAAGCMLRLVLWPTEHLWNAVHKVLEQYSYNVPNIAFHFRCSDSKNPHKCIYSDNNWLGGDSPIDLAKCGIDTLQQERIVESTNTNTYAYITSDYEPSARQLKNILEDILPSNRIYISPKSCHIDYVRTSDCTFNTIVDWFILSLSDYIVTQSGRYSNSIYAPESAFSRYAVIYSLNNKSLRLPKYCLQPDTFNISHQYSGNWFCSTRRVT
eukprot:gene5993-12079_t